MSINSQKKDGYTVELEIAVGAETLKTATDEVFRRRVKGITVPGFRKGKAPRKIIERMYGEGVFLEDAVNELYPKAYQEAVDESGIEPVAPADIDILDVDKDKGFTFKATVTVKPEIGIGEYKGIAVDKVIYPVGDGDVDHELSHMQEHNARIVTVEDRAAQLGDTAVIDFEGFLDGVAFEGGKGEDHSLELGSGSFIPGFEEQIVGHRTGEEFEVNVTFPEEYHSEELKGKAAVFKVALKELREKQLPDLDDEFAKDVSEFDTLDELKASLREKMEENRERKSVNEMETALIDTIVKDVTGEIPEAMYSSKIDDMVRDFDYRLRSQGMNMDLYLQYTGMDMPAFRESFRDQAERQVKMRLALEKIAALEKLSATEEEIEGEFKKLAEMYGRELEEIKKVIPEKDVVADLDCNKAVDLVKEHAKITEITEEQKKAGAEQEPEPETEEKPVKKASKTAKKADEDTAVDAEAEEAKPVKKPAARKKKKAEDEEKPADSEA